MKKLSIFLAAVAATVGFVSCNKAVDNTPAAEQEELGGAIEVNINSISETKAATGDMKDFQINQVQVFVFDKATGRMETDKFVGGLTANISTSVTLNTKTGAKVVYALVNHPRLYLTPGTTGELLTNFEARLTDLSENTAINLVMSGRNEINVVDVNRNGTAIAPQTMDVYVKRLVARIQLDALKVDFRDGSLQDATFTVKEIYLKNVVGKSPIGVQGNTASAGSAIAPIVLPDTQYAVADNWYNKMRKVDGAPACVDDVYDQACTVAGAATAQNRVLFTFPNNTVEDSNATSWNKRHTRLVIKAHVTKAAISIDKDTYYVLDLPVLAANTVYEIKNVNITMLGKDDDNDDSNIDVGRFTPTVTVDDWTGITELNYEF